MFVMVFKMVILRLFVLMVFFGLVIGIGILVRVDEFMFFFYEYGNEIMVLKFKFFFFEEGLKIKEVSLLEKELKISVLE